MGNINSEVAKVAEQDDVTTCGICSEPFKDSDVAVQVARWDSPFPLPSLRPHIREKFWAHPVCVFSIAKETQGPADKHKPK
jgi:hypothetical protein